MTFVLSTARAKTREACERGCSLAFGSLDSLEPGIVERLGAVAET